VKASPDDQAKLVDLGRIDMDMVRAQRTLASLPAKETVQAAEEELLAAREEFRLAQEDVEGIQADVGRAESDVELVDKRIDLDTKRLAETSSAKDAQGLDHELSSLRDRRSLLEDVQLELMEKLEQATAVFADVRARVIDIEQRLEAARSEVAGVSADTDTALQALRAERARITETLPADLLALYDRQRERYGQGVSVLTQGVSSASGVKLTESDLQTIRQAADDDVVLCPDSNAILVRAR
jgi:predicted  nucleic acid-binding Zn-ribbon protein